MGYPDVWPRGVKRKTIKRTTKNRWAISFDVGLNKNYLLDYNSATDHRQAHIDDTNIAAVTPQFVERMSNHGGGVTYEPEEVTIYLSILVKIKPIGLVIKDFQNSLFCRQMNGRR